MSIDFAPNSWSFFLFNLLELIFILIPSIVFKIQGKEINKELKNRIFPVKRSVKRRIIDIIAGVGFGFIFFYLSRFMSTRIYRYIISTRGEEYYTAAVEGSVNTTPPFFTNLELAIAIIFMFILVGLCEEFCFRGVILKELNNKSKILGVLLSSGIFMIYHVFPGVVPIITFLTFWPYYLVFGIILALIVMANKNDLLMAIIAHGTFNSILLFIQYA